jgi:hypothetical protein
MPLDEFWHGDMRLLKAYQVAYFKKASFEAWQNGFYSNVAVSLALGNAFAKKGAKPEKYPKWQDPTETMQEKVAVPKDINERFRIEQLSTNAWLSQAMKRKE